MEWTKWPFEFAKIKQVSLREYPVILGGDRHTVQSSNC